MSNTEFIQNPTTNVKKPTVDAQFKHLRSYGSTELKSAVYIDAYDSTQPDAKAPANQGKSGQLVLGCNQLSNPVGLYGKDTQHTVGNPNKGKLSIKPNVGAAAVITETVELMGIGADDTNAVGKAMPTGAWIRCRNDVATPINAAFSLTNIPEGGATNGKIYSCVVNNTTGANPGDYNMYITDITAGVESNTDIIKINPTSATAADITLGGPSAATGSVIINNHKLSGIATLVSGTPSTANVVVAGLTTTAVILLTQSSGAPIDNLLYNAIGGSFTISTSAASTATIAWFVARL
jgi:hypothetical protein